MMKAITGATLLLVSISAQAGWDCQPLSVSDAHALTGPQLEQRICKYRDSFHEAISWGRAHIKYGEFALRDAMACVQEASRMEESYFERFGEHSKCSVKK